jgi:hypothetical protein
MSSRIAIHTPSRSPSRAALERKLRQAEAQADSLRQQLAQIDEPDDQQARKG